MKIDNTVIENLRKNYAGQSLDINDVASDPFLQFNDWFKAALSAEVPEPNAMTLATATPDGKPAARVVLLKSFDQNGFVFYTNYNSRKGQQLETNPNAALCFLWLELHRQVRIEGTVSKISAEASEKYFQSRPKGSQIGAWASAQSSVIQTRKELEDSFAKLEQQYEKEAVLPKPPHWGGYCLNPTRIEFWQGRRSRLHDRVQYTMKDGVWKLVRLAP